MLRDYFSWLGWAVKSAGWRVNGLILGVLIFIVGFAFLVVMAISHP